MLTLTEIIFSGKISTINISSFTKDMLSNYKEINLDSPYFAQVITSDEVINIFKTSDYVNLVITYDKFNILEINIPRVFSNIGIENGEIEILIFFDLKDLNGTSYKEIINILRDWCKKFQESYKFDYFRCQIDNADEDEYYFDSYGLGPEYKKIR